MVSSEVWAVILSLVGAFIGYALREYQNRVSPIFEIIRIATTSRRPERVEIDAQIVETLRHSFYPQEIQPETTLGDVFDTWDRCDDLEKVWPTTKREIQRVIDAETDDDFKLRFGNVLRQKYFDRFLMKLLLNNRLDFHITSEIESSPEKINTWYEDTGEYKVWFDLPPAGVSFGSSLNHPAIKGKCESFILAVSRFHRAGIEAALHKYISIFDSDYAKALGCLHDLKQIDYENERWLTHCFLANTSTSPIVIERHGTLTVEDTQTKTTYREECYLAVLDKDGDLQDTDTPVVIAGGEGKQFALLTSRKQKEMNLGSALRELYVRRDGQCYVSIYLRRLGLFGRQIYRSSTMEFSPPRKQTV